MPRLRVKVPIDVEVSDEMIEGVTAAVDVVTRAKESGLIEALGRVVRTFSRAATSKRGRRRRDP